MLVLLLALQSLMLEPEQTLARLIHQIPTRPPLTPQLLTPQQTGPGKKNLLIQ